MSEGEVRKIRSWWWLIVAAAAILANFSPELFRMDKTPLFISTAIFAGIIYRVTRWADAYEHETKESLIWTGVFGCGVSILVTMTLYGLIPNAYENNFVVSIVEESSKALVLIPLLYLRVVHSWTDGLVFGSMAGLGFSISEDFWYALDSDSPLGTIIFREIFSIFGHSLFSAFLFAAISALYLHTHKSIFLIMATLAISSHWLWNAGLEFIDVNGFILYAIVPPAAFVLLAYVLRRQEKKELIFWGEKLVESGAITLEELNLLSDLDLRKNARKLLTNDTQKSEFDRKISSDIKQVLELPRAKNI